ncbi:hypothetical protein KEM56_001038 [Ascosphaera pollenicola]|nr:hypothetical protein KEM56_001038 [Ascosphaera pollenicola]
MSAASARESSASSGTGTGHPTRSKTATNNTPADEPEPTRPAPPPPYRVFKCDWDGCGAELHNLETLRKHVSRLHVTRQRATCHWKDCQTTRPLLPGALSTHLGGHLEAVAMKLGDGPSSIGHGHYDTVKGKIQSKAFLYDKRGRVVTPEAQSNSGEVPAIIFPAPPMAVRDFNTLHHNISRRQKCQAVIDALAAKQKSSGISMVKEGCTFMNFDRLQTVSAFETIYETFDVRESLPLQKGSHA